MAVEALDLHQLHACVVTFNHWAIQLLEEWLGWNLVAKNMADFGLCWRQIHATCPKSTPPVPNHRLNYHWPTAVLCCKRRFAPLVFDKRLSFVSFLSWFKTIQDAEFCIVKNGATALPQFFLKKKYLFFTGKMHFLLHFTCSINLFCMENRTCHGAYKFYISKCG